MTRASPGEVRLGTVAELDEARGLGEVREPDGHAWSFHCTAISDGTRRIEAGTPVAFCLVPGHLGRMEAGEVTPLGP
ncbi:MAG: hypothetical protein ACRDWE_11865 [Acidimicrobiales bacterium]